MPTRKRNTNPQLKNWLLRSLLVIGQRSHDKTNSGFVLPTVVMVTLVVVLLTTALVLRSFDRSKNASNTRVNEVVLNASSPAIDRAKAKLNALFDDPTLPRATPSDSALYNAIKTNTRYTFGDETRLKVGFDINGNNTINPNSVLEQDETSTTAWRFPVDTDNNGKFDSYTLYGVFFRSPPRNNSGQFSRARTPLDAKTPPMDDSALGGLCANIQGTSASLVGDSGWYKSGGKLKKSFFVYTATVPITSTTGLGNTFETYRGNKGFSALEYQQDRGRIPLSNNAVVYEDDLQLTPGPGFNLNGRIFTNSNFLVAEGSSPIRLYQVSGKNSCYYEEETGKILVGGNVASGAIDDTADSGNNVDVHLFQGKGVNPFYTEGFIDDGNKSTTNAPREIAYNSQAYIERVNFLVASAIARGASASVDPPDIRTSIQQRLANDPSLDADTVRREELEIYFRKRIRRVPFLEVPFGSNALFVGTTVYNANTPNPAIFTSTNPLVPPQAWIFPTDPADGKTGTGYTGLTLKIAGNLMSLPMTFLDKQKRLAKEMLVGDRVGVGNNLPELVYDTATQKFRDPGAIQGITGVSWNNPNNGAQADGDARVRNPRTRQSVVNQLADLGITDRDGFWEKAAAQAPATLLDNVGGLRVVTGAGIFSTNRDATAGVESSFLPAPPQATYDDPKTAATEAFPVVWPDTMPMWQDTNNNNTPDAVATDKRGDLVMRATAVYHYQNNAYNPSTPTTYQTPIACVSSYYDPSTSVTAKNVSTLPYDAAAGGRSNNGVSYEAPSTTASGIGAGTGPGANGLFTPAAEPIGSGSLREKLNYQANLVYPSGRFVNEQLRQALTNRDLGKNLTLAEQSAIDSTICAIQIKAGAISANASAVPHGAIREVSFLNASQPEAIDRDISNLAVTTGVDNGSNRVYTMPNTAGLKVGDVVTIRGFTTNPRLNADKAAITEVSTNTEIKVVSTGGSIPQETAAARIVEALTSNYDLSIEERQPVEVRATVLNLNRLRGKTIGGASPAQEYLLPNSGVIYATRDDALLDLSASIGPEPAGITAAQREQRKAAQRASSPVDFRLDSSRRPNAILLEDGSNLSRVTNYRAEEKGLILATNLPAYVIGNFNLHTGGTSQEFNTALTGNWDENDFYNRTGLNPNFACRPGQFGTGTCSPGDTWRPATVLADSVTLLSDSFGFGFRDQGDFDLNNNEDFSDTAKSKRRKNGFFDNSYMTSSNWWDAADNYPLADFDAGKTGNQGSSYVNNFVTPIQRRVNEFPEYIMEICRKVPVSECRPGDWVVGYDFNGDNVLDNAEKNIKANQLGKAFGDRGLDPGSDLNPARIGAGTTARLTPVEADRRYPRRVAFARNIWNALVFTLPEDVNDDGILNTGEDKNANSILDAAAKPLGVGCPLDTTGSNAKGNGCRYPKPTETPTAGTHFGNPANNALWFRTTANKNGQPGTELSYNKGLPLNYLPPVAGGPKLILPDTQCFTIGGVGVTPQIVPCAAAYNNTVVNLNLPATDKASDYLICTSAAGNNGDALKTYSVSTFTGGNCNPGPTDAINQAFGLGANTGLLDMPITITNNLTATPPQGWSDNGLNGANKALTGGTLYATSQVNVYSVDSAKVNDGTTLTLDANGQIDPVFVIKTSALLFGSGRTSTGDGVKIDLKGVNPNDVFWVMEGDLETSVANAANPHKLVGNFLGKNGAQGIEATDNVQIEGGRFLGFTQSPDFGANTTAVTSDAQPALVPVLQLQVTTATPGNRDANTTFANLVANSSNVARTRWMPRAVATTFNLVSAAGDTPARVGPTTAVPTGGEPSGGLHNFVRFLELWAAAADGQDPTPANISGSFIQFKRSAYATSPHQPIFNVNTNNATSLFGYLQGYKTGNNEGAGGSNELGKVPYYEPPRRNWGFDVALLSQLPDLFAQRFTLPPAGAPDEFFREVGRDDQWVSNLLCAAVASDRIGSSTATYSDYAVPDASQRPANCPTSYPPNN